MLKLLVPRHGVWMVKQLNKALNDVVDYIKDSNEYKTCLDLKKKMSDNEEVNALVRQVKLLQQKYIKSNYNKEIKKELDEINKRLDDIPIYVIYKQNLEKVNNMINTVKDELNNYFDDLLNKKDY